MERQLQVATAKCKGLETRGVWVEGLEVEGSGIRVQGSGLRVESLRVESLEVEGCEGLGVRVEWFESRSVCLLLKEGLAIPGKSSGIRDAGRAGEAHRHTTLRNQIHEKTQTQYNLCQEKCGLLHLIMQCTSAHMIPLHHRISASGLHRCTSTSSEGLD
eukprot:1980372-Rhodomonas_salina.1